MQSNGYQTSGESSRSEKNDFFDIVEQYLQGHDITMDLPLAEAKVTVSSRNLAQDELNFTVNFAGDSDVVEGKGKKGNFFKKGVLPSSLYNGGNDFNKNFIVSFDL